jgi:hypothetical protein
MTGNNSAATVAKDMLRSFPIKIGLMVGVGGGVWSKKVDVRLGDVVVSQPEGIYGGVVQWDFGKIESGCFIRTGSLNKPPRPLLNAVQDLQTRHITDGDELAEHLPKLVQNKPRMAQTFTYQGTVHDCLYESTYSHAGGETCDGCDIRRTIKRRPRITSDPCIHYGRKVDMQWLAMQPQLGCLALASGAHGLRRLSEVIEVMQHFECFDVLDRLYGIQSLVDCRFLMRRGRQGEHRST